MKQKMKTGSSDDSQSIFGGSVVSSSSAGSLMNARQFVKSCEVPELSEESLEDYYETVQMVKDVPRFYQHDLYRRIMADDSAYFCYLPTGMGKTLIACLVLSKMLELNPDRCFAYFVTDKILLAIQQMEYIRKQFADGVSQHLKIGALCGTEMMLAEGLNDPTKHNILVVTAEYLKNRLENRALKWQAACCVIFDEVHHCDLKHPYNNLIKTFHTIAVTTPVFPKLIGLTASPAIKDTGKSTFELLLDRLRQFGEAKLVTASPEDINKHRVIPEVDFHARAPLPECQDFAKKVGQIVQTFLMENQPFLNALPRRLKTLLQDGNDEMNRNYNITIECEKFLEGVTQPSIEKGVQIVLRLVEVIFLARIVNLYEAEVCLEGIMPEEGLGIKTNYTCRMIISVLQEFREQTEQNLALQSDVTPYSALLEEIEKTFPDKESKDKNIFLLILVRTRCDALALTKIMQKEPRLMKLRLEVDCVVGHGGNASTSGVKGMNVKKQFKTLHAIPDKHILVATSVAEEGIDIPGCEKVIMFEAPKDTTAFVQIKGRARKQQSTVILIGPPSEQAKLHNLIHSEKYMLEAVQHMDNQTIPQQIGFN